VLRVLGRLCRWRAPRALSIVSGNEPQFRILESACRGIPLTCSTSRPKRWRSCASAFGALPTTSAIRGDYRSCSATNDGRGAPCALDSHRMALVTLHLALTTARTVVAAALWVSTALLLAGGSARAARDDPCRVDGQPIAPCAFDHVALQPFRGRVRRPQRPGPAPLRGPCAPTRTSPAPASSCRAVRSSSSPQASKEFMGVV
jgi:hypothetical protein